LNIYKDVKEVWLAMAQVRRQDEEKKKEGEEYGSVALDRQPVLQVCMMFAYLR